MTRTFSKIYGLAALRLGWAYCPGGGGRRLTACAGRSTSSTPALAAGVAALEDRAHVEAAVAHNERWLPWLTAEIEKLGLKVTPSVGNFVLIHFPKEKARNALPPTSSSSRAASSCAASTPTACPTALRMTIGTESDNRAVVAALSRASRWGRA